MKYRLVVLFGVICGSLSGVFVRWSDAPSSVLVVYRMAVSVLLLLPGVYRERAEFAKITKKTWLLCALSGTGLGLSFLTFFDAVKYASISACAILGNIEVMFVALIMMAVFKRRLSAKAWAAILIAFGGAVIIALADGSGGGAADALRGDILAIIAAALAAVYTVAGAVCRKTLSTSVYSCLIYFFAALSVSVLTVCGGTPLFGYRAANWLSVLGLVVFCTFLSHNLFSWSLKYLSPPFISTMKLLDPLCATLWALLLFGERPGVLVLLGGAVVISGVLLYGRAEKEEMEERA